MSIFRVPNADQLTLYPMAASDREVFAQWDADRDVLTFVGNKPRLGNRWTRHLAVAATGEQVTVEVRRASCGAGCVCAGEYRVVAS